MKCEIHDCTIALFDQLFRDRVSSSVVRELRQAKRDRVDIQYYTHRVGTNMDELAKQTKDFVLEIEKIIDRMNAEELAELQSKLRKLIH